MKKAQVFIFILTFMALLISNLQYIAFLCYLSEYPFSVFAAQIQDSFPHLVSLLSADIAAYTVYMWTRGSYYDSRSIFIFLASVDLFQTAAILLPLWNEFDSPWILLFLLAFSPYLFVVALINCTVLFVQKEPRSDRSWIIANAALMTMSMVIFLPAWLLPTFQPLVLPFCARSSTSE